MSNNDFIDDMFGELEAYYPGSKRKRREPAPKVEVDSSWENDSLEKTLPNGRQVEVYMIGSLAKALNRTIPTIRQWMKRGKLPESPYRMPSQIDSIGRHREGRRFYSKAMVEITIELFAKAGLLSTDRIDWTLHQSLTSKIAEAWETIRAEENKSIN